MDGPGQIGMVEPEVILDQPDNRVIRLTPGHKAAFALNLTGHLQPRSH